MEKKQVIERFCTLSTKVRESFGNRIPADCFCGDNPLSGTATWGGFQFDEQVIRHIEEAVEMMAKINRDGAYAVVKEETHYVMGDPLSPMFSASVVAVYLNEQDAEDLAENLPDTYGKEFEDDVLNFKVVPVRITE